MNTLKNQKLSRGVFLGFILILTFIYLGVVGSPIFLFVVNLLWLLLFTAFVAFVAVGALTFFGKKDEASQLIDLFTEGSLTVVDIMKFLKELANLFVNYLIELIFTIIPYISYFVGVLTYIAILLLYKNIGRHYDVAGVTILLSVSVTLVVGLLSLSGRNSESRSLLGDILKKFKRYYIDAFEVMIFVLFLTIDRTDLFFLPKELNVELKAMIGTYNLMTPSFVFTDHISITVTLIALGVILELARRLLRIINSAVEYYKEEDNKIPRQFDTKGDLIKNSIRVAVGENKDDILKFTAFTTFMMAAFLFFPRLKLVALIAASGTSLLLDILIRRRIKANSEEDLLSRTFNKVFNLN